MIRKVGDCQDCKNTNCLIGKHGNLAKVAPYIQHKFTIRCKKSQQFILEGTPVSGLYFIYQGCVKISKHTANNREQIIRFSKDGEIVGHRGWGTNYVYDISATALQDTTLCFFPSDELIRLLHEVPQIMFDIMLFYADQLQKSESNAKRFGQMTVRDKVINGLLFIRKKFGNDNEGFFNIVLSRRDIADFAGTTEEQVIRVISNLKKEGLLIAKGKKLGIPDLSLFKEELPNQFFLDA